MSRCKKFVFLNIIQEVTKIIANWKIRVLQISVTGKGTIYTNGTKVCIQYISISVPFGRYYKWKAKVTLINSLSLFTHYTCSLSLLLCCSEFSNQMDEWGSRWLFSLFSWIWWRLSAFFLSPESLPASDALHRSILFMRSERRKVLLHWEGWVPSPLYNLHHMRVLSGKSRSPPPFQYRGGWGWGWREKKERNRLLYQ